MLVTSAVAVVLFLTERIPPALVALFVLAVLLATGVVSATDGFHGFANPATVTVAAMFVFSAALERTGAVSVVADLLGKGLQTRYFLSFAALLLASAATSAFINNTTVVAVLIPVILRCSAEAEVSPSKLLMPVSFAAMFGGVCTLVGTSTNLVVDAIAIDHGEPPIGIFEMAPMGLVLVAAGTAYLLVAERFVPSRRAEEGGPVQDFHLAHYLTDIELKPGAPSVGKRLDESRIVASLQLEVVGVLRDSRAVWHPDPDFVLAESDVLRVRCDAAKLRKLRVKEAFTIRWPRLADPTWVPSAAAHVVEVAVSPRSWLEGQSLRAVDFLGRFNAMPLAIRHQGQRLYEDLETLRLAGGDVLLLAVPPEQEHQLLQEQGLIVLGQERPAALHTARIPLVLGTLTAVVIVTALNLLPISAAATIGAVVLILGGALTLEEAQDAIRWQIVFLLAGLLTLGSALESTGAALLLSGWLLDVAGALGPHGVLAALYLVTTVLTSVMSNNATAALLTPIALAAADQLGVDTRPMIMAVAFAASTSFATPVGYQTNTMVYGVGHYRFADFVRIGGPLTLLFCVLSVWLIPVVWPFHP